jgi:hypothetical protein
MVQGQPKQIALKTPSPNNQSKMDWRSDSRGGAPALQVQSPEFKLQSHTKKKTPMLRRLRQEDLKFKVGLNHVASNHLKKKKQNT